MYSAQRLTQRQTQILEFLQNFKNQEGVAPTYREISGHFGFKSTKAASDHVRALEKKGYVRLHGNRSRSIEIISVESNSTDRVVSIPIFGEIPAGTPDVSPNEGEVVVALIDGDNTLKTLAKREKRFYLKAENPGHPDWIPMEEMIIQGVVKAVLRRI